MVLSNLRQTFLILLAIAPIFQGCGSAQTNSNSGFTAIPPESTAYPFSIKEPLVYSGELVQKTGDLTTVYFVARNGDKTRIDFDRGGENQISNVYNEHSFVVSYKTKSYFELPTISVGIESNNKIDPLIRGFLEGLEPSKFEKVESKYPTTIYRVNHQPGGRSENLIYYDDINGIPFKQEFFRLDGEQRTLVFSVEFRDLKFEADESLFAIPAGFRKTEVPK